MEVAVKEYILRLRATDKEIFLAVKNGAKKIETRVATPRYQKIGKGDILVFVCGKEKLKKEVLSVKIFSGVASLFKQYRIKDVMPQASTLAEAEKKFYSFTGYKEKIKKFGLAAFELKG